MLPGELEITERRPAADDGRPPLLFVHGLAHAAWCWEPWMDAVAEAGYHAVAVSLRGHGGSGGRLRAARLGEYADDVVRTAAALPRPPVLVGHSMGGLVVQVAMGRYAAPAVVLMAPVPAHPAVVALAHIARQHPQDALRLIAGGTLPLRPEYLFEGLPAERARGYVERCGAESAVVQYQLVIHTPPRPPLGAPPVLVQATPDDRLIPLRGIRATAARYGAQLQEYPGMGHDLMLDAGWQAPLQGMLGWLDGLQTQRGAAPRGDGAAPDRSDQPA